MKKVENLIRGHLFILFLQTDSRDALRLTAYNGMPLTLFLYVSFCRNLQLLGPRIETKGLIGMPPPFRYKLLDCYLFRFVDISPRPPALDY